MLATLSGSLALLIGLALLLLPLVMIEISRPGDSFWGTLILLMGLVWVIYADRVTGIPALIMFSTEIVIGRLILEIGHWRWHYLALEEREQLWSSKRWRTIFRQFQIIFERFFNFKNIKEK